MAIDDPETKKHRVSSPEARERLLAEALAHAEQQDAHYRQPLEEAKKTGRWKASLSLVVFAIAAYVAVAPPAWLASNGDVGIGSPQLARGTHAALRLQAMQIEVFQIRNDRLPRTLSELPVQVPGLRYIRSNNRVYQLVAAGPDGEAVIYDSARPDEQSDELIDRWIEEIGR